jgi:hypothetical protein
MTFEGIWTWEICRVYAVIKYGFILVITIVVLYFVARYLIPLLGD